MIKRINKIKNFGVFKDFQWDSSTPDFNKHNLIYGWNYSGKTTISRIFRCFELCKKHADYLNAEFELKDEKDPSNKYNDKDLSTLPNVRVFNTDFILENLKWYSQGDEGLEPISFLIGKENIELQKRLERFKTGQKKLNDKKTELIDGKNETEKIIGNALTDKARYIKKYLSITDYDKAKLKRSIEGIKENYGSYLLNDADYDKHSSTYKNTEQRKDVILNAMPTLIFLSLQNKTKEIMERKITVQKIIEELKNDENLNRWVNEGRELHKDKTKCAFCGNDLPSDLFLKLDQHFSIEYERLEKDIKKLINDIKSHKTEVEKFDLPANGEFYAEFVSGYKKLQEEYDALIDNYIKNIDTLLKSLESKQLRPFEELKFNEFSDNSNNIKEKYNEIKSIVEKHKNKTANFTNEKKEAKAKLINHYSAEFIQDQKYFDVLENKRNIESKIEIYKNALTKVYNGIVMVEEKLSEFTKGAEKVNEYIRQFFQHDGIKIEVTEDSKFKIIRNNEPAKNLSEGEKTAISFAYFVARLEDKKTKLDETIVFIDDPVSSLDCNHLFNIYAFIKSKLINCGQLFVSTHNLEFFNLMKDFIMEITGQNGKYLYKHQNSPAPYFLIQKEWGEKINRSRIINLPKELNKYKSEYVYLFSIILNFENYSGTDFNMMYILPNIGRRFLEGYLGLKYPDGKPWKEKLCRLVKDEAQRNLVYKFVNEFSHNSSAMRSLKFPDMQECKQAINIIMKGLKENDKDHYDALYESCN